MDLTRPALPLLRRLDPERAHGLTLWALKSGLGPRQRAADDPILETEVWGLGFPNPLGLAAGFDKDAEVVSAALDLGFGHVEAGTVTPRPQPGNPKPRLFRLAQDAAAINRMGFNNRGLDAFAHHLSGRGPGLLGANIGRNKDSEDAVADYVAGAKRLGPLADYLAVNVSSPNTPGLRALQDRAVLEVLVAAVRGALAEVCGEKAPPMLVKIAPDLTDADKDDIAAVALECGIDGLIVSNTTIERPEGLSDAHRREAGGLSGKPLMALSTRVLAEMYRRTGGHIPLVGVGGIASGADAYAKIRAGASLVQLYTALVYRGPALVGEIKRDLAELLRRDGFAMLAEAVGADHR
ncbi:MAG: quinone-dependent dihydroorotate dehydrogenase [Alphaproteobacteria bacterium]|jgi:dihydroorotate dehydrogenase|nr:quinone-dependent dihydroorotate dehydrogenase [Alphaproteobacteria bacterium]